MTHRGLGGFFAMIASRALVFLIAVALALPAVAQRSGSGGSFPKEQDDKSTADNVAPPPSKKDDKQFPLGNAYVAVSLNGKPFTSAEKPGFTLDKQFRARGFGGCNSFTAVAYPLKSQGIAVGPINLTRRSCAKELMDAETAYLTALRTAQKWDLIAGRLVFKGPNGEIVFDRSI
jgi:heat shock protein HslJ